MSQPIFRTDHPRGVRLEFLPSVNYLSKSYTPQYKHVVYKEMSLDVWSGSNPQQMLDDLDQLIQNAKNLVTSDGFETRTVDIEVREGYEGEYNCKLVITVQRDATEDEAADYDRWVKRRVAYEKEKRVAQLKEELERLGKG
jgi:hypothetical protein